jgi:PilZ domain
MAIFAKTTELVANDEREWARIRTTIHAKLNIPAGSLPCTIVDLSAGGAAMKLVARAIQSDTIGTLDVDGFGAFDGIAMRYDPIVYGFRFLVGEAERLNLIQKLAAFVNEGLSDVTHMRGCERWPSESKISWTAASGEHELCDVLNISLQGVSLKTKGRPPLGELLHLGRTYGRVVRHHDQGFALQYVADF